MKKLSFTLVGFTLVLALLAGCNPKCERTPLDSLVFENGYDELFFLMASYSDSLGPHIEPEDFQIWVEQELPAGYEFGAVLQNDSGWTQPAIKSIDLLDKEKFSAEIEPLINKTVNSDEIASQQMGLVLLLRDDAIEINNLAKIDVKVVASCGVKYTWLLTPYLEYSLKVVYTSNS